MAGSPFTSTNSPGTVTATNDGCLTVKFTSDVSVVSSGWASTLSCYGQAVTASADTRNVISGNTGSGISLSGSDGVAIVGNYIGVGADGTTDKGNGTHGILLASDSDSVAIGGATDAKANIVAYNGDAASEYGISISDSLSDINNIYRNSIHDNQNAGIALAAGANNSNAAPASITSSTADTPTHDTKKLSSGVVSASAVVQIFEADDGTSCEGERYIGQATANGSGAWSYNLTGADNDTGVILVLTETDTTNGTSAFSSCYTLTNLAPTADAGADIGINETDGSTPLDGSGSTDPEGAILTYVWTETADASDGCAISNATTVSPTVTVSNKDSTYTCTYELVVNDGTNDSVADSVIVTVTAVARSRRIY